MIGNILHTNTHEHKYILKNENKRERKKNVKAAFIHLISIWYTKTMHE